MPPVLDRAMAKEEQARLSQESSPVKTALTLLSGNAVTSLLLLLRNLSVAVLIPVADYGVAATFAIAMAVVEMASHLGLHQQIVQSAKGEDTRFQAALQGFQVLRGVMAGVVLFALAGPLAAFMGVAEVAWAYQVLAMVPVLNALQHFDMHRLNRDMVFGPLILTGVVPALLSFAFVWPLAAWLGDYRVMLWAIVLQAVLMLVMSHVVAHRPYRLVWDRVIMGESLSFGWPLLVNGALLFAVFQGDKIIVGRVLGMEALALLAMGFTLTLTPMMVLAGSVQRFFLPQLSRRDADFVRLAQVTQEVSIFLGAVLILAVAALGPWLVGLVLGMKYAALEPLLLWLALMQGVRMARTGHAVVALSVGQTSNAMWANVIRVALLPVIWWAAVQGASLQVLIWIGIVGEIAGYLVGLILMVRRCGVTCDLRAQGAALVMVAAAVVQAAVWPAGVWVVAVGFGLCCIGLTGLRAHLRDGRA